MTPSRLLRIVSVIEACTWAFLLFAMAAKYGFAPELGDHLVHWAGSAHGAGFLAYLFFGLVVAVLGRWPWWVVLLGGLSSIPPFATLLFDWWVERRGFVPHDWEPRERPWKSAPLLERMQGLVPWMLRHPITLGVTFLGVFLFIFGSAA